MQTNKLQHYVFFPSVSSLAVFFLKNERRRSALASKIVGKGNRFLAVGLGPSFCSHRVKQVELWDKSKQKDNKNKQNSSLPPLLCISSWMRSERRGEEKRNLLFVCFSAFLSFLFFFLLLDIALWTTRQLNSPPSDPWTFFPMQYLAWSSASVCSQCFPLRGGAQLLVPKTSPHSGSGWQTAEYEIPRCAA